MLLGFLIPTQRSFAGFSTQSPITAEGSSSRYNGGSFIIVPLFFYTPETLLGGGVALNYSYFPFGSPRASRLTATTIYTQNNQFNVEFVGDNDLIGGKYNLFSNIALSNYPDRFFGIGNDTSTDDEETYTHRYVLLRAVFSKRLLPAFMIGAQYEFEYSTNVDLKPGGLLSSGAITGSDGGNDSGIGVRALLNKRDAVYFPTRGYTFQTSLMFFNRVLRSDYRFTRYTLDVRGYLPLWFGSVLGAQLFMNFTDGMAPFHQLSLLGGKDMMRGYYLGRYRDNHMVLAQFEWRQPLFRRFGVVGFAGVGDVAPDIAGFRLREFKYSLGGGIRYQVDPRNKINIRLDVGFGRKSRGIYFALFEAF
jgi:outer membrane protein assembly factor BamA